MMSQHAVIAENEGTITLQEVRGIGEKEKDHSFSGFDQVGMDLLSVTISNGIGTGLFRKRADFGIWQP